MSRVIQLSLSELNEIIEKAASLAVRKFVGEDGIKLRMNVFEVSKRLGKKPITIVKHWKDYGLKVLGKGSRGSNIYCGRSVLDYEQRLKGLRHKDY